MSGKTLEYKGKREHLISEAEYLNTMARSQFYTGFVLKNDGKLIRVNQDYSTLGIATGHVAPLNSGTTIIVAQPQETNIYDPVLIAEAKRQLETKWYPVGGQFNWFYGLGALAIENTPGTFRWRSGLASGNYFSPKYYANGWLGGSRARISTQSVSGIGKALGYTSLGFGFLFDGIGLYKYYRVDPLSSNAVSLFKFGLNLGISIYGAVVPGGAFVSIGYFSIDSFYPGGAKQFIKDGSSAQDVENERNAHNGGNAWTRPRIIPWGVK